MFLNARLLIDILTTPPWLYLLVNSVFSKAWGAVLIQPGAAIRVSKSSSANCSISSYSPSMAVVIVVEKVMKVEATVMQEEEEVVQQAVSKHLM